MTIVYSRYHQGMAIKPHTHESQSPFPSRPNRGGSKLRKPKTREEADTKVYFSSGGGGWEVNLDPRIVEKN